VDGESIGAPLDLYAPAVMPTGRLRLSVVSLSQGQHLITFTVTGKNPASRGYYFGLDVIALASPLPG
jgi:hypothetical protein